MEKVEVLIIGAGVVGLAIGRELAIRGHEVVVCEKDKIFGSGISSRNSGVIHAGIYYSANSLKARLCVKGRKSLYHYARERNIPHKNCGKLVVATNEQEELILQSLYQKAQANGVDNLRFLSRDEACGMEPELNCHSALHSPSSGIIDIHTLMEHFISDIESKDGIIAYQHDTDTISICENGFKVYFENKAEIFAKIIINSAGLSATKIAHKIHQFPTNKIPHLHRAKGNYFSISGKSPFTRLIYPIPVAGGLGAHFTMNMAGESLFGPDVEWLNDSDEDTYFVDQTRAVEFYKSIQKYWPNVVNKELLPAYAGIRPKLKGCGMGDSDFLIQYQKNHGIRNLINLFGIESPGLTSCMAIASYVEETLKA